jgi:putative endopeptidase
MRAANLVAAILVAACSSSALAGSLNWGVNLSDQDRSVRPGDNFAMYENGSWYQRTTLTPLQANAAYWRDLRIDAGKRINAMLSDLATNQQLTGVEALVANFHRSAANTDGIDRAGLAPLNPELAAIRAAKTKAEFARLMGSIEGPGTLRQPTVRAEPGRDFFSLAINVDRQNPGRYALYVNQAGLILPGPQYYTDAQFADIRASYQAYVSKTLRLIGWQDADARAAEIVQLETAIAKVSSSPEQLRDQMGTYHRMTLERLRKAAPDFPWAEFLRGAGIPAGTQVVIDVPPAIRDIAAIYAKTPLDTLRAKQAFGASYVNAARLDSKLYASYRDFAATALAGLQAGPDRDLDVINLLEASIPDAVGQIYVRRYSSPEVKAKAQRMSDLMKDALAKRVAESRLLSPSAKQAAQEKLASLRIHMGYPDHFDSYAGLRIDPNDLYGNVSRSAAYDWKAQLRKLGQPVPRSEWTLTPFYPQYNYDPARNSVDVPAALLVPPFFNADADDAVNYGADGSVIGSQIIGALFGPGSSYDSAGRLNSWLPQADAERLDQARRAVGELYSREEPLPGMHLKGELLADEAMQDIGGLQIALDAYHASLGGKEAPVLDGYTGDQRFFLGRAQMWRAKFSPEFTRNQVATGSNAPPYMRINGPMSNVDAWYSAFGVAPGDKLYIPPEQRARLW